MDTTYTARTALPSHALTRVPFRRAMVAIARAECEHARADWERLQPHWPSHDCRYDGPHPSEFARLPHEAWAATLLNIDGHLSASMSYLHHCIDTYRGQSRMASRDWQERARYTLRQIRIERARRDKIWAAFLEAARRYHEARAHAEPRFVRAA